MHSAAPRRGRCAAPRVPGALSSSLAARSSPSLVRAAAGEPVFSPLPCVMEVSAATAPPPELPEHMNLSFVFLMHTIHGLVNAEPNSPVANDSGFQLLEHF